MQATKEIVQELVENHRLSIIQGTKVPLEEISVSEIKAKDFLMYTHYGNITVNCNYDYNSFAHIESTVFHELGHRVFYLLNSDESSLENRRAERFWKNFVNLKKLKKYPSEWFKDLALEYMLPHITHEGIADCLGYDVFPKLCNVSEETKNFVNEVRLGFCKYRSEGKAVLLPPGGYYYFHDQLQSKGKKEFLHYLSTLNENNLPNLEEMKRACLPKQEDSLILI